MSSLAFIEVKNFISAVEAADTILKISPELNIKIEPAVNSFIIVVGGRSALVKTAFESIIITAKRWGKYLFSNFIEESSEDVYKMVLSQYKKHRDRDVIKGNGKTESIPIIKAKKAEPPEIIAKKEKEKTVPVKKLSQAKEKKPVSKKQKEIKKEEVKETAPQKEEKEVNVAVHKKEEKEVKEKPPQKRAKLQTKDSGSLKKSERKKEKTELEDQGLFSNTLFDTDNDNDTISRLRREALGAKIKTKERAKPVPSAGMEIKLSELEILNVWELRRKARNTPGFPIQGRQISKANRGELLDNFKKMA